MKENFYSVLFTGFIVSKNLCFRLIYFQFFWNVFFYSGNSRFLSISDLIWFGLFLFGLNQNHWSSLHSFILYSILLSRLFHFVLGFIYIAFFSRTKEKKNCTVTAGSYNFLCVCIEEPHLRRLITLRPPFRILKMVNCQESSNMKINILSIVLVVVVVAVFWFCSKKEKENQIIN